MRQINKFRGLGSLFLFLYLNQAYAIDANSVWVKLWGKPEPKPMLALGMWSYHLKHESQDMDNSRNDLIGFSYDGLFAATLINSENRRSYAVGVQRYWLAKPLKPDLTWQLGYRLGLIYGYDEKLGHIATISPIIPFPQLITDMTWKNVGLEISYTWVVVSTSFYIRF